MRARASLLPHVPAPRSGRKGKGKAVWSGASPPAPSRPYRPAQRRGQPFQRGVRNALHSDSNGTNREMAPARHRKQKLQGSFFYFPPPEHPPPFFFSPKTILKAPRRVSLFFWERAPPEHPPIVYHIMCHIYFTLTGEKGSVQNVLSSGKPKSLLSKC